MLPAGSALCGTLIAFEPGVADTAVKDAKETAPPPVPQENKSSKLPLIIGVTVVALIAAVGAFFWLSFAKKTKGKEKKKAEPAAILSVLHLETFVVNIADPEQKAFLRVGVDLGLDKKPGKGEGSEAAPIALVRDVILGVLSVQKPDDLLTPEGKRKLKEDLLRELEKRAPELGAREAYFTEFLMQR